MASNESRSINGCRRNKPIRKESSGKIPEVFIPMDEGVVLPAAVIAVWQFIASLGIVSTTVLPSPVVILQTFQELLLSGELWGHLEISLYRAAAGFLLERSDLFSGCWSVSQSGPKHILIRPCKCSERFRTYRDSSVHFVVRI